MPVREIKRRRQNEIKKKKMKRPRPRRYKLKVNEAHADTEARDEMLGEASLIVYKILLSVCGGRVPGDERRFVPPHFEIASGLGYRYLNLVESSGPEFTLLTKIAPKVAILAAHLRPTQEKKEFRPHFTARSVDRLYSYRRSRFSAVTVVRQLCSQPGKSNSTSAAFPQLSKVEDRCSSIRVSPW